MRGSLLDCLCATLEEKMAYQPGERDMVFLQHRFGVETASGEQQTHLSTLLAFGEPNGTTAMALTVGVPCGIAVQLVLDGLISQRGGMLCGAGSSHLFQLLPQCQWIFVSR
jgi:saccharopine dehydrogenase (NADP+, L-glutamate forming)